MPSAVAAIPSNGVEQQQIDRLQGPCRLLGERVRLVADFALGRIDRVAIGAPGVVARRSRQKPRMTSTPSTTIPNRRRLNLTEGVGLRRDEDLGDGGALHALIRLPYHTAHRLEQLGAHQRLGDDLMHPQRLCGRPAGGQARSKLGGDGDEGAFRMGRPNVPNALRARPVWAWIR